MKMIKTFKNILQVLIFIIYFVLFGTFIAFGFRVLVSFLFSVDMLEKPRKVTGMQTYKTTYGR